MKLAAFKAAGLVVVGLGLLAAGFGAGSQLARSATTQQPSDVGVDLYEVGFGEVGQEVSTSVTMSWPELYLLDVPLEGRLTRWLPSDGVVDTGETVVEVDGAPVVAAVGQVPAYRALSAGMEGDDVRQLQQLLTDLGFELAVDGRFGTTTGSAVARWNRDLGLPAERVVPLGRVLFFPTLPALVAPEPELRLGARLASPAVSVRADVPEVSAAIQSGLAGRVSRGAPVTITLGETIVDGRIVGSPEVDEDGSTRLPVELTPGACAGRACWTDGVPRTMASATIEVVPVTSGPVVPTTALVTDAAGTTGVELADGTFVEVEVMAAADGLAVVQGLEPGQSVRLIE